MSVLGPVASIALTGMTNAVTRLTASAQRVAGAQISPVDPIAPHRSPPAGLLVFDPSSPDVDLNLEAIEQIRALHQFRASARLFEAADETAKTVLSLKA